MLTNRPLRDKLRLGIGLLGVGVVVLFAAALHGLYAYRGLVKSLSARAAELPLANDLSQHVADLRVVLSEARERKLALDRQDTPIPTLRYGGESDEAPHADHELLWTLKLKRDEYRTEYERFEDSLAKYRARLERNATGGDAGLRDDQHERETLREVDRVLARIERQKLNENLLLDDLVCNTDTLLASVEKLRSLTSQLPSYLHKRLRDLAGEVRSRYHLAMSLAWGAFVGSIGLLFLASQVFRRAVARPVRLLVAGARKVASGDYSHRIRIDSRDELGELAVAMNSMMHRFETTRADLDRQVRERSEEVVRSEQLASVGFLAAGVAHEINNPLASIAMCSESLESRIAELVGKPADAGPEWEVVQSYLEMIGRESFRCKQITDKLLDFSRRGDPERRATDLCELVEGVLEMVQHLGRYKQKNLVLVPAEGVVAEVEAQEFKQVVLNLVTNALDSLDVGGTVSVEVRQAGESAEIVVHDDGCGMTDEVKRHLFEPFFTRRRGGQGTGLGLSITHRIIEEHHGQITAQSPGPGEGSTFTVTLPLRQPLRAARPSAALAAA
ncbi:MAG: ATP-binding protein [Lacipirellulaceae bacterium]